MDNVNDRINKQTGLSFQMRFDNIIICSFSIPVLKNQLDSLKDNTEKVEFLIYISNQLDDLLMRDGEEGVLLSKFFEIAEHYNSNSEFLYSLDESAKKLINPETIKIFESSVERFIYKYKPEKPKKTIGFIK
ncbi:MAG: hypothetical protein V1779_00460 [bacterium]